jgi:hypothetical protein
MLFLSFKGQMRPLSYVIWSFAVFLSQYLVVFVTSRILGRPLALDEWFFVMPLRSMVVLSRTSYLILILALAYFLIVSWALVAFSFRRAANAAIGEWIAAFVIAPIVQIPAILVLWVLPPRVAKEPVIATDQVVIPQSGWMAAAQGVLAGAAMTLASVAVGALVFGVYGFGMFVVSPFVIGAMTAYLANRNGDIGSSGTAVAVVVAAVLGGVALVMAALEGIVCIVLASPLGLIVALVGGVFGREVALYSRRSARQTLSSFALLPLVFAMEHVVPATTALDVRESVLVNASPDVVWNAIVHMDALDEPLALLFRLGVAYPLGGEIVGEGVGAIRYGVFSTGTALERVTEWVPPRRLAFTVLNDVPAMRELSAYSHVHAPHVVGYFTTKSMSFELVPRSDGRTEIVEQTSHELRLDPIFYWLPFARLTVHENNARVLEHIRRQSERE